MANFIIFTASAPGHINPTIPICRKLVERGHKVVWITSRILKDKVEKAGARFHPMPEKMDRGEMDVYEFYPELAKLKGIKQIKWYIINVFLDTCYAQIGVIDDILKNFKADVLIGDTVMLGPYLKSEMDGISSAMISLLPLSVPSRDTAPFGFGLLPGKSIVMKIRNRLLNYFFDNLIFRDVNAHVTETFRRLKLPLLKLPVLRVLFESPSLVMQLTTPAFEYPRTDLPRHFHYIGPVLQEPDASFSPPDWWPELQTGKPVILITQGTVATNPNNLIVPALKGLEGEDLLIVVAPGADLGMLPQNVKVEKFIPFDLILPYVSIMVTNGGYGGTQTAFAHGIPVVVAGQTDDKMEVAARVAWSKAGINLKKQNPSPLSIKLAVKELLFNPVYRKNAQRIQTDFARYNAPEKAAELLETLAEGR